jgi:Putative peptidoglycan binding domain
MKTGLQDNVKSSPRSPASDHEFAASLATQLSAQAERFHKASPIPPASTDDDFGTSLAAKLEARSKRLRAGALSAPPPPGRSDYSAPDIDPREAPGRFASWLASIRIGHVWLGFFLLMLFAGAAVLAVHGLTVQPAEPLRPSHIQPAKAALPRADDTPEKAPPPASESPPPASESTVPPPPASPAPAVTSEQPPAPPAPAPASQTPLPAPAKSAPLKADEIRELQGKLKALGFDPGAVDGIVGPNTLSAVRKYSEARADAGTEATRDLLARLRSEALPKK